MHMRCPPPQGHRILGLVFTGQIPHQSKREGSDGRWGAPVSGVAAGHQASCHPAPEKESPVLTLAEMAGTGERWRVGCGEGWYNNTTGCTSTTVAALHLIP
jgi:hypothetical protein